MLFTLIVEDNPANLALASRVLERAGHRVAGVATAAQAVDFLTRERPDLVLMDIGLPDIDGLELTRRLRADPATSGLTIVALTAHARREDEAAARDAGCDGFITKPIDTRLLAGELDRILASK
ncbi:MAG: response regulator [Chloroflexi bacterium]|nr:MAG: response regulator [Chloroflexota bacterium]TME19061.1 MAG: response regulator [Chloroflexota bacterium]